MDLTQEDIEVLDRFIRNELKGEELSSLQTRMKDPEFAAEVKLYLESVSAIENSGRVELRSVLTSIHNETEKTNGFDEYKPSKGKGGSGSGGGIIISVITIIVAVFAYLFYSGKLDLEQIEKTFTSEEKTDTVYHYNIVRDTVGPTGGTTVKKQVIRYDTVFTREKVTSPAQQQPSLTTDTILDLNELKSTDSSLEMKIIENDISKTRIYFAPQKNADSIKEKGGTKKGDRSSETRPAVSPKKSDMPRDTSF